MKMFQYFATILAKVPRLQCGEKLILSKVRGLNLAGGYVQVADILS